MLPAPPAPAPPSRGQEHGGGDRWRGGVRVNETLWYEVNRRQARRQRYAPPLRLLTPSSSTMAAAALTCARALFISGRELHPVQPHLPGSSWFWSGSIRVRIKALMDRFVKELQKALDADIQDRIMKEREMPATSGTQTRGRREGGRLEGRALPPRDGNFFGVVSASFIQLLWNVVG
ncbi:hypothetical protein VPH35_072413 [Triticum aestivum]|uniref:uncharacterized protein n=1 Tax=Triticum aestivum TaxID=4565 RepID=UPI0003D43DA9|nr:uncharacterized protein LOC123091575 [Triticum aestivum]